VDTFAPISLFPVSSIEMFVYLQDSVHWEHYGTPTNIQSTLDIDIERRVVYGECGGYCGGCRPEGSLELELDTCPEEGIKRKSASTYFSLV